MIRKEYQVQALNSKGPINEHEHDDDIIKHEILKIMHTAFLQGALVELKILEGVDLTNEGKRFSKVRMDIVSNTDFDKYEL